MGDVIIRYAKKKDISQIYKIGNKHKDFQVSKKIQFYRKDELEQWVGDKRNNIFLVAVLDSKLIGFIYCKIISRDWVMVDNFFVLPEFRKKGIGSKMEKFLEKEIKRKEKVDYVVFLVKSEKKPFRRFLRKHGFKEHSKYIWIDKFL